jgi:glycosyltransferase involved in cell wall biosynthesis/ribosomal protein S18 acetylase RimI-like enzyme
MTAHAGANRIRILHIVGDSRYGGIAGIILGLGRIGRAEGWQVDILATDPIVQHTLQQQSLGIVNLDVIRRRISPLWDLVGLFRLHSFLRRHRYEIVHTHTSKAGFIGRLAAWRAGVPAIVHTVHGFAFHEQSSVWVRIAFSALERMASRWCHRIVSVSEFHRRWAVDLHICSSRHIQAIPNGIAPLYRREGGNLADLRRQLGAGEGDLLILTPARLVEDKGLTYLIEAAAILPRGAPGYRVAIAGDGPVRTRLERLASDRGVSDVVTFLGFREDVGDLLAASDMVVLTSLREGLSISLLEAMAAARPIIATSIGSHRELASQAEMARLVPPANPVALAEAIQELARDPALRARLAEAARRLFEARYTEDRMLNAYRQLYLSLLEPKPPVHRLDPGACGAPAVRRATARDLPAIVNIHQRTFNQFFLTQMGAAFLRLYYKLVLDYRAGIVLVSEKHGILTGFVCGFADPAEFYRLMWRNRRAFLIPAVVALVRRPLLAANVIQAIRRVQSAAEHGPRRSCELSSIAVTPGASGNGVAGTLLRAFLNQSWAKNAECVYLTTDAEANEAANQLYQEIGFRRSCLFLQRRGRWMNEYQFHRAAADQSVEACP